MRTLRGRTEAPTLAATLIEFDDNYMRVHLSDGRVLFVPNDITPRLRNATPEQRQHYELIARGTGIHWEAIDEDLSVAGLVRDFGEQSADDTSSRV